MNPIPCIPARLRLRRFFSVTVSLCAVLFMTTVVSAQTVLLDDAFTDLDHTVQSLPERSQWFYAGGPDAAKRLGTSNHVLGRCMELKGPGVTTMINGYFAAPGGAKQLEEGDSIELSMSVTMSATRGSDHGFRIGLYNSNNEYTTSPANRRPTADVATGAVTDSWAYGAYSGYGIYFNPINPTTATPMFRIMKKVISDKFGVPCITSGIVITPSNDTTRPGLGITANVPFPISIKVTRKTATTVEISVNVNGTTTTGTDTDDGTSGATSTNFTTAFDNISMFFNSGLMLSDTSTKFADVRVTYTPKVGVAQTLANDTFADVDRKNQSLPDSIAWFMKIASTTTAEKMDEMLSVPPLPANNNLLLRPGPGAAAGTAVSYFTAATPQDLADGDALIVRASLRAGGLASLARGIRVGLFNSGGSRATTDYEDGVTPVPAGLFGGYRGYSIDFDGNGAAAGGMQLFKRNSAGTSPALFVDDAFTQLGADTVGATALNTSQWSRVNFRIMRNGAALRVEALINDTWVVVTDDAPDTLAFDTLAIHVAAGGLPTDLSLNIDDVLVVHSTGELENISSPSTIISENFNTGGWSGLEFSGSAAIGSVSGNATREAAGTYDGFGSLVESGAVRLSANPSGASGAWFAALRSGMLANTNTLTDPGQLTLAFDMRASNTAPVLVMLESLDGGGVATGRLERWVYPAMANSHQRFAFELSDMMLASGAFDATAPNLQLSWRVEGGGLPAFAWPGATALTVDVDNVHLARPRYYVSPDGNNSNPGTADQPFATVSKASSLVEPGDIVLIRAGSGAAPHYEISADSGNQGVRIARGGKPAAWVTFKAYPGETPVLRNVGWTVFQIGAGTAAVRDRTTSVGHVEIRGLTLNGIADTLEDALKGTSSGSANTNGVAVEGRRMANHPHHIRVADCVIQHCSGGGIATMQCDYITAENNLVRDNGFWSRYGPSGISLLQGYNYAGLPNKTRHFIVGNHVIHNQSRELWAEKGYVSDGNGIIIDNFMNNQANYTEGPYIGRTLVQANVVALNGGSGMHAYQSRRVDVVNNSSWHNSQVLNYGEIWSNQSDDVRFYNNILVSPPAVSGTAKPINPLMSNTTYPIVVGVTYHNNLYQVGAGSTAAETRTGDTNNVTASPSAQIYVDAAAGDFRLFAGSPAFDIGQSNAVTSRLDIAGMPRATDGLIDAGAFERQPVILRSPASLIAVPGGNIDLSVEAVGDSLTYAWTHNGTSLSGATLSTLAISAVTIANTGTYVAVVSTPFDSVQSAPAIVSMADNPPPPEPDPSVPGVTGGGDSASTIVTTAADLKALASSASPEVIMVQGVIDLASEGGSITVASDKSIQGLDGSSEIIGGIVIPETSDNIILRGLTITNPAATGNGLYINGGHDVFVTHCTFYDCAENLALITKTTGNVTVSWSRFHYTGGFTGARSAMKIGVPAQEAQPIGVTLHHNYWGENISANMPVITHGRVHMYDNYFKPAGNSYGTIASDQTELLSEGNIYQQTANPLLAEQVDATLPSGLVRVIGNAYNDTPGGGLSPDTGTSVVFVPAYRYTLSAPTSVSLLLPAYAGNNAGAFSVTPAGASGAISIAGPDETLTPYTSFTLTSSSTGGVAPVSYQWRKDNFPIDGATESTYTGTSITGATHSGTYVLTAVLASGDTLVSGPKGIAVAPVEPPVITAQPVGLSKIAYESANFTVVVDSTEPPAYQWYKDGVALAGRTSASLTLINVQSADSGQYTVEVHNSAGVVTSDAATLVVNMLDMTAPQGSTGNKNGGGAPSLWFLGALALMGVARRLRRNNSAQ